MILTPILQTIAQVNFGPGFTDQSGFFETDSKSGATSLGNLELFISRLIGFLTILAGIFFILYFVMGALKWVTAGGDSSKVQKARDEMIQGVLGMILIVAAYAIVGVIGAVIGFNLLNPASQLIPLIPGQGQSTTQTGTGSTTNQTQQQILQACLDAGGTMAECQAEL